MLPVNGARKRNRGANGISDCMASPAHAPTGFVRSENALTREYDEGPLWRAAPRLLWVKRLEQIRLEQNRPWRYDAPVKLLYFNDGERRIMPVTTMSPSAMALFSTSSPRHNSSCDSR